MAHNPTREAKSITVTAGTTSAPYFLDHGIQSTVTAIPGAGGTMLVEYTTSPVANVYNSSANWISWPSGTVSAATSNSLIARITAVRATATTQNGTLEVLQ